MFYSNFKAATGSLQRILNHGNPLWAECERILNHGNPLWAECELIDYAGEDSYHQMS